MKESKAPVIGRTPFQKWLDKYQGILYLIPWIIGFVVFKAFPFGQSLYYSFTDMNFFKSGTTFVGLQNYITAFTTTPLPSPCCGRLCSARTACSTPCCAP